MSSNAQQPPSCLKPRSKSLLSLSLKFLGIYLHLSASSFPSPQPHLPSIPHLLHILTALRWEYGSYILRPLEEHEKKGFQKLTQFQFTILVSTLTTLFLSWFLAENWELLVDASLFTFWGAILGIMVIVFPLYSMRFGYVCLLVCWWVVCWRFCGMLFTLFQEIRFDSSIWVGLPFSLFWIQLHVDVRLRRSYFHRTRGTFQGIYFFTLNPLPLPSSSLRPSS